LRGLVLNVYPVEIVPTGLVAEMPKIPLLRQLVTFVPDVVSVAVSAASNQTIHPGMSMGVNCLWRAGLLEKGYVWGKLL
jgi:hypothetical protein